MSDWFAAGAKAGLCEHAYEALLSEVFGYEIFLGVPGTKLRSGILWKQAVNRNRQAATGL